MSRGWHGERPPDETWRCPADWTRAERATEQDEAAGGRRHRYVADSGALASIALRIQPKGRSVYAYLRWSERGKTRERYVCEVRESSRTGNLERAWEVVRSKGMVAREGYQGAWATDDGVRAVMQANRGRDTRPELRLRAALRRRGLGYRVGMKPLKGLRRTADVVFVGPKVAVFIDGCFWHGCQSHYRPAKRNTEFWSEKIAANRRRDRETDTRLVEAGWAVIRVWEHEDPEAAADSVVELVRVRRKPREA